MIRSEKKKHFMYLSTESTILPPGTKTFNIKGGIISLSINRSGGSRDTHVL